MATSLTKEDVAVVEHVDEAGIIGSSPSTDQIAHGEGGSVPNAYPNRWARIRDYIREPSAEFLGTMILTIFGTGANCQVTLSTKPGIASSPKGSYISTSFGWAIGYALGVWCAAGISGGHINPSVTLSMAIFRRFPWKKVPIYFAAQIMGAMSGAAMIYINYAHAIAIYEGGKGTVPGTAALFSTYPLDYMTPMTSFTNEFIGTFVLLIVILAATDKMKATMIPPSGLLPLVLFFLVLGIGACLGMQTGFAINPARDLGPRLMTAMFGYGKEVFTYGHMYWLWCPIVATFLGGIFGSFYYDLFIYLGSESPLNKPNAAARARHDRAVRTARGELPAGVDVV